MQHWQILHFGPLGKTPRLYVWLHLTRRISDMLLMRPKLHTSQYHGPPHGPSRATHSGEVYIHRVNDTLEIEWHLHIQNLSRLEFSHRLGPEVANITFDPTSKAKAVLTLTLVPRSSCCIVRHSDLVSSRLRILLAKGIWTFLS